MARSYFSIGVDRVQRLGTGTRESCRANSIVPNRTCRKQVQGRAQIFAGRGCFLHFTCSLPLHLRERRGVARCHEKTQLFNPISVSARFIVHCMCRQSAIARSTCSECLVSTTQTFAKLSQSARSTKYGSLASTSWLEGDGDGRRWFYWFSRRP